MHFKRSTELLERAKQTVVGGVKKMNLLDGPEHFPLFFERALGPHTWDVDGNRYIDLIAGKGSLLFGAADPRVDRAVTEAIRSGGMLPLTSGLYVETAERLLQSVPSMARVKFLRSGSCAVTAAVRMARVFSGHNLILSSGYHGWHDWFIQDRRSFPGDGASVIDFHYNPEALARLLSENQGKVAAVVVTPEPTLLGEAHLAGLAAIVADAGCLLVLDEVRSAFRASPGAYHAAAGITPDLCAMSKAIANGYPLAAVGGRREVMEAEQRTHISGTYETENIGLAAGNETMRRAAQADYSRLHRMYLRFQEHANRMFRDANIPAQCAGTAANATIIFDDDALALEFYRRAVRCGILFYYFNDINLTFSHESVMDELLQVLSTVTRQLSPAQRSSLTRDGVAHHLLRRRILSPEHDLGGRVLDTVWKRVNAGQ